MSPWNPLSREIEERWRTLVPDRALEPQRIERDIFALGLWLQEQELEDALETFGGSLSNAREIQRRESLRSTKLRCALGRWFLFGSESALAAAQREEFVAIAKALQRRWPARGPGSAKRPAHLTDHDLDREIHSTLTRLVSDG